MGMRWWRTNACERASQWISLDLDGELSQLERAALDRHLAGCARCAETSADVGAFTRLLREAPLVELERPVVVSAPRRARARAARRAAVGLAFAGISVAAVLGGFVVPASTPAARSTLSFQSVQAQRRFAEVETQRLEPVAHEVEQTWCVGNCVLG